MNKLELLKDSCSGWETQLFSFQDSGLTFDEITTYLDVAKILAEFDSNNMTIESLTRYRNWLEKFNELLLKKYGY